MPLSRHHVARTIRDAPERAKLGQSRPHVLRRTLGTSLSEAGVPVAASAAILGHAVEVNLAAHVKAHRDALERSRAREALVEFGLGVTRKPVLGFASIHR